MDQTRTARRKTQDTQRGTPNGEDIVDTGNTELRILDELELMLAGGGDSGPIWP